MTPSCYVRTRRPVGFQVDPCVASKCKDVCCFMLLSLVWFGVAVAVAVAAGVAVAVAVAVPVAVPVPVIPAVDLVTAAVPIFASISEPTPSLKAFSLLSASLRRPGCSRKTPFIPNSLIVDCNDCQGKRCQE